MTVIPVVNNGAMAELTVRALQQDTLCQVRPVVYGVLRQGVLDMTYHTIAFNDKRALSAANGLMARQAFIDSTRRRREWSIRTIYAELPDRTFSVMLTLSRGCLRTGPG